MRLTKSARSARLASLDDYFGGFQNNLILDMIPTEHWAFGRTRWSAKNNRYAWHHNAVSIHFFFMGIPMFLGKVNSWNIYYKYRKKSYIRTGGKNMIKFYLNNYSDEFTTDFSFTANPLERPDSDQDDPNRSYVIEAEPNQFIYFEVIPAGTVDPGSIEVFKTFEEAQELAINNLKHALSYGELSRSTKIVRVSDISFGK
jgi:hypothetical protein